MAVMAIQDIEMTFGPIKKYFNSDDLNEKPKKKKKKKPATISDYDAKGRPVGKGGRAREKALMDRVYEMETGRKRP
jgi:hypothetical protein